jgi:hypothetical protein
MALRLRYVGARPYTEFRTGNKLYGFARGMERDDVPDEWIEAHIRPSIDNGSTMWEIEDLAPQEKAAKMKEVIEAPPVVEEVIEEPVVEEPVVEETVEEAVIDMQGFDQSLTRAQMMSWCAERGIGVANTDTKASLTEKANAYLGV